MLERENTDARLVNEEYEPKDLTVSFSNYKTPAISEAHPIGAICAGVPTGPMQGLFVARGPDCWRE